MDGTHNRQHVGPPLHPTEIIHQLELTDGTILRPEIDAKIDKGFFMADSDWTCYRRNYFSLQAAFSLHPLSPHPYNNIIVVQHGGVSSSVRGFAISIAAVVDGPDGKAIELVQHTPKRDKGPQEKPGRIVVVPRINTSTYGSDSASRYDTSFGQNPTQPNDSAQFERIQFKNATANNGKRRAAQQYYHLLVELFADLGPQYPDRYIKIASRISAPMVVRGRSPGHYQSERRGSHTSTGQGGSGGAGGGGSYTPGGSASRTSGDMGMSGGSTMVPGSSYGNSYDTRSHPYRPSYTTRVPLQPIICAEDARGIDDNPGFGYYPGAVMVSPPVKQESPFTLPSMPSSLELSNQACGRFEGFTSSKGHFPAILLQHEMNMT